jgi:alpha-glucosidase/alpha-D-xyloside xylohydrolase
MILACLILTAGVLDPSAVLAEAIHYAGKPAELSLSAISDRTAKIEFTPLDDEGRLRTAPVSTVLVEQRPQLKWRGRELLTPQSVTAGKLRLEVKPQPLTIVVHNSAGKVVQEFVFTEADGAVSFRANAPILGMGEGARQFDRRGGLYTMKDGWGAWNLPILGSWVAVPFLIGTDGWAFFVHHPRGQFDLRERTASFKAAANQHGLPLELYVIAWDRPADVLEEYIRLTGRPVMPPKWALGYMQSHRTLSGPDEVLQVAHTFRDKKLPCDALIYLGTGYCPAGWNTGHGSLQFNPKTFDKPAEMIEKLLALNFHVVLHQNRAPRTLFGLSVADPMNADKPDNIAHYWDRHRAAFALGVDGWWPDDGDELPRESRLARHRMYYEGPLKDRPNVRPWSLHRTGYAGVQRYGGWIWSGDVDSRWETLAAQVSVGQNHSLSISPYWGTDIGGFIPKKELTGELYVRWFQFGTFCPSFRSHGRTWHLRLPWGWDTGDFGPVESREGPDPSELHNAAVEQICCKYLELRYRLLPYTYTLCREAHDKGLPLIRALWLYHPDDREAIVRGDQYYWGRDLLVAPVTTKGTTQREVYLPEGDWYDFWTRARHRGRQKLARQVDLATLPIFVRAGAILPLDPPRQFMAQPTEEPTTIQIYTGHDGDFHWYEDDGLTLDYLKGRFTWTHLTWNDREPSLTIEPVAGDGTMQPIQPTAKALTIELIPGGQRRTIRYAGERTKVTFSKRGVTAPPDSFFDKVPERDRDAARGFYKKYLDINGLPVAASGEVADEALERTHWMVSHMLAGRPDILEAMVQHGTRLIIIGKDQVYTDMPEYRHSRNPQYQNERVRGTGGLYITSFGEENLRNLPLDRYDDESIAVHEFCHTIDSALRRIDPTWRTRLAQTYRGAIEKGLWKNTYAGSNQAEYWAEICQSYFDCNRVNNWNHGPIGTREQLKLYDPDGYDLVRTTFNLTPENDWRYQPLLRQPSVTPPPARFKIDPYYAKFTYAREFTVLGSKHVRDEALLKVNDTIRRMFAYRHDILKALIADGARLVVLAAREKLSNLPEFKDERNHPGFDAVRYLDYDPGRKLMIVPEENVLGLPSDPCPGRCLVVSAFAKGLYHVTAQRQPIPDFEQRRDRQQYELRVRRLDVEFDRQLRTAYEAALSHGLWKGTAAARDRVEYWTAGVVAYFDAAGQGPAPSGADRPISTREALKAYDPGLFALTDDTMAYKEHVDWRFKQASVRP